jgi:RNA recognition motif-containing protein
VVRADVHEGGDAGGGGAYGIVEFGR